MVLENISENVIMKMYNLILKRQHSAGSGNFLKGARFWRPFHTSKQNWIDKKKCFQKTLNIVYKSSIIEKKEP